MRSRCSWGLSRCLGGAGRWRGGRFGRRWRCGRRGGARQRARRGESEDEEEPTSAHLPDMVAFEIASSGEERVESSGLEHDLMTSRRAPRSTTPPFRRERGGPAAAYAATDQDFEIGERHVTALLGPDRAKRKDRVERVIAVHTYVVRRPGHRNVSATFRSMRERNARAMPADLRRR